MQDKSSIVLFIYLHDILSSIVQEDEYLLHWEGSFSIEELQKNHQFFRENVQELLQANRNKLNTPEGYGIIDGSHEDADFRNMGISRL